MRGSRTDRAEQRLVPMARSRVAVAAVQCRLSGQATFPAPLDDARAAVRWLRAHAAELIPDGRPAGTAGLSSGPARPRRRGPAARRSRWRHRRSRRGAGTGR
nr:alpha/beta hydrolase fold domain-containing protein [Geodermatophilus ruber]